MNLLTSSFIAVTCLIATTSAQWDDVAVCGQSKYADAGAPSAVGVQVVSGWDTRKGEWPWQVSMRNGALGISHYCGANILNDHTIVTAAHCCEGEVPADVIMVVGEWDTRDNDTTNPERSRHVAKTITMHQNYSSNFLINDICLVELETSITYNPDVRSVCAPERGNAYADHNVSVSGWGSTSKVIGTYPATLQTVNMQSIDNELCDELMRDYQPGWFVSRDMICAGTYPYNVTDSCGGDSGGPMVTKNVAADRFELIGLVSWGTLACANYYPGVYARVEYFLDWIAQHAT